MLYEKVLALSIFNTVKHNGYYAPVENWFYGGNPKLSAYISGRHNTYMIVNIDTLLSGNTCSTKKNFLC